MPIIKELGPFDQLARAATSDPGLRYLESQKAWKSTYEAFRIQVEAYYSNLKSGYEPAPLPKTFTFAPRVQLRPEFAKLEQSFLSLLKKRKTRRELNSVKKLSFEELSTFLLASYGSQAHLYSSEDEAVRTIGERAKTRRSMPGPGGIYPLEVYFICLDVEGLSPGLYHFHPVDACLELMNANLDIEDVIATMPGESERNTLEAGAGLVVSTAVFQRSRVKYGERYLRFCLIETGSLYHNMDITAQALELMLWPQGSIFEKEINHLLEIDGVSEAVLNCAILGA